MRRLHYWWSLFVAGALLLILGPPILVFAWIVNKHDLVYPGRIIVKVIVDENGKVVSAQAQNGPAALREAAEAAARQATFAPVTQDGITVRVVGTLTYDFKQGS